MRKANIENILKKAQRLYKADKLIESLAKYEIVIQKKFWKYSNLQVKFLSNPLKIKDANEETISKPIDPNTVLLNIHTDENNRNNNVLTEEENDTVEMSLTKNNQKLPLPKVDEADSIFLTKVIKEFNVRAMQLFNTGDIESADKILSRLIKIVSKFWNFSMELVWLTLNNMSCIHKKNHKSKKALSLLLKVLEITQNELKAQDYAALTYLNLSAVYSELKKHKKSIYYASKAIEVLTSEIEQLEEQENQIMTAKVNQIEMDNSNNILNNSPTKPIEEEEDEEQKKIVTTKREKTSLLAIAYYNQGTQYEFKREYKECIDSFRQAISVLEKHFAPNYPLTIEFRKTLSKAMNVYFKGKKKD